MEIKSREIREETRKQFAKEITQKHDNLLAQVQFLNKTYVSIEESLRNESLSILFSLK
jgi:phage-related minor tail protein